MNICRLPAVALVAIACSANALAQTFADLHHSAEVALAAGNLQEALSLIDRAIAADGNRTEGHTVRAELLWQLGRKEEAQQSRQRAEELHKQIEELYVKGKDALNSLERAMRRYAEQLRAEAETAIGREDWAEAADKIIAASGLLPDLPGLDELRRKLPIREQRVVKEVVEDRRTLRRAIDNVVRGKAEIERDIQNAATAPEFETLVRRLDLDRNDAQIREIMGFFNEGQIEKARAALTKALADLVAFDAQQLLARARRARDTGDTREVTDTMGNLTRYPAYARDVIIFAIDYGRTRPLEAESLVRLVAERAPGAKEEAEAAIEQIRAGNNPGGASPTDASASAMPVLPLVVPTAGQPWTTGSGMPMRYITADSGKGCWVGTRHPTRKEWTDTMGQSVVWPMYGPTGSETDAISDNVTYGQALRFCAELTRKEREAGRLPAGYRYTLPTMAEHEAAYPSAGGSSSDPSATTWEWCMGTTETWTARCPRTSARRANSGACWILAPHSTFVLALRAEL